MNYLGTKFDLNGAKFEDMKEFYAGCMKEILIERAVKAGKDPEKQDTYINSILNWVDGTDFYDAPASTRYHESFKHGLLFHTIGVYNNMLELIKIPKFSSVELQSAALVCLVHDWCKIGAYEAYLKNVKNEETGQWEKQLAYKWVEDRPHPFGHGVTSMYMAMKTFNLTEEEALAIRFHMGLWDCGDYDKNDLSYSNHNYPTVLLLHFSDELATCNY